MTYYSSSDLARGFRTVRQNTIQIAQDIPEANIHARPAEGTRTVLETLAHVASQSVWQHALHGRDRKTFVTFEDFGVYMQEAGAFAAALTSKAAVIGALEQEGAKFAAWLESLSEADLATTIGFPAPLDPPQKSRFEMLLGVKEHEMHHRGQLMIVQRQLGLVPHLTRARQARSA
jgi:uncharacterized damage-inducible protein DinB